MNYIYIHHSHGKIRLDWYNHFNFLIHLFNSRRIEGWVVPYTSPARSLYLIWSFPLNSWSLATSILAYKDMAVAKTRPTTPPIQPRGTMTVPGYPNTNTLFTPLVNTYPAWNHESVISPIHLNYLQRRTKTWNIISFNAIRLLGLIIFFFFSFSFFIF